MLDEIVWSCQCLARPFFFFFARRDEEVEVVGVMYKPLRVQEPQKVRRF